MSLLALLAMMAGATVWATGQTAPGTNLAAPSGSPPQAIPLAEAIRRAQANEPSFAAAAAESKVAAIDRSIARAALLPSAEYHNQYLFTQSDHLQNTRSGATDQNTPIFIANNAIHEYASQAVVTETFGLRGVAEVERATAASARATAELEVARRGLVATVVELFFGSQAANQKLTVAQRALDEAKAFATLTTEREQAREAAHADVVKAQLQLQQRQRELADAALTADKARLELALLLFPDPRTPYTLSAPDANTAPPTRAEVETQAARQNPEIRSALASLRVADVDVLAAKAAYLPDLSLNFSYGIDAAQFATKGIDGSRNLGYSAMATLDIPVWNWLSTQNKIKQSTITQQAARVALTATQKRLVVALDEYYAEALSVHDQLASLETSVQTAAESLRLTRLRYTSGEATVLEVVDAEGALTAAENAREDGFVRYQAALANLQTLTGTM